MIRILYCFDRVFNYQGGMSPLPSLLWAPMTGDKVEKEEEKEKAEEKDK